MCNFFYDYNTKTAGTSSENNMKLFQFLYILKLSINPDNLHIDGLYQLTRWCTVITIELYENLP